MYQISGGGYGGNADHDGLTNGCSTIGISKSQPVEVMEQYYPMLFTRFALREGSGGAGAQRGGFGVHYEVELLRGEARASFVMDHGRFGPPGVHGGGDGAPNVVRVHRGGETLIPEHLSKDQDIPLNAGDRVEVMTPGGGGYGDPLAREPGAGGPRCRARLLQPQSRRRRCTASLRGRMMAPSTRLRLRVRKRRAGSRWSPIYRPATLEEALAIRRPRDGDGAGRRHGCLSSQGGARRLGRHAPRGRARHLAARAEPARHCRGGRSAGASARSPPGPS